jgi:hypothetical protein
MCVHVRPTFDRMPRPPPHQVRRFAPIAVVLWAGLLIASCAASAGSSSTTLTTAQPTAAAPAPQPRVGPSEARAERAVTAFSDALRAGDVARLCRPNGVLTAAVVRGMNSDGESCERSVELSTVIADPAGPASHGHRRLRPLVAQLQKQGPRRGNRGPCASRVESDRAARTGLGEEGPARASSLHDHVRPCRARGRRSEG